MRSLSNANVLIIGAGTMGAGVAQLGVQAGHKVRLLDSRAGAAEAARRKLAATFETLVQKGRLQAEAAAAALSRLEPIADLSEAADSGLVIEAIVEELQAKKALLAQLEKVVGEDCVLATNTSSLSITALANGLSHPQRLVGMHFFNPAPLMKLVEVVSGLQTSAEVAESVYELSKAWGKTPVYARSTPGFIVNRIARPYYAEALALLQERAASPETIDRCFHAAGFRMGPCELMDLIGHDVNIAVTESVYAANFFDKRYVPSVVQREMVDGGLLGRKSGRGFYDYSKGGSVLDEKPAGQAAPLIAERLRIHGFGPVAECWAKALQSRGTRFESSPGSDWVGVEADGAQLRLTDGRPATLISAESGNREVAVFDLPMGEPGSALAWAASAAASQACLSDAENLVRIGGWLPEHVKDIPGLVVGRTIAMLVNEACDALHQEVCTADGADLAMKLGANYPAGPFELLSRWGSVRLCEMIRQLDRHYRGERYRISPLLKERAWLETLSQRAPQSEVPSS